VNPGAPGIKQPVLRKEEATMASGAAGTHRPITILMADDDEDDRAFAKEALESSDYVAELDFVNDGQELVDYLRDCAAPAAPSARRTRPALILLDLTMPRKDGRQALAEIKAQPDLRRIPVVVLTISNNAEDVRRLYDLGASSFIVKPVTKSGLEPVLMGLAEYWSRIVTLPDSAVE
jgi:CheY-like chemotaxis protein